LKSGHIFIWNSKETKLRLIHGLTQFLSKEKSLKTSDQLKSSKSLVPPWLSDVRSKGIAKLNSFNTLDEKVG